MLYHMAESSSPKRRTQKSTNPDNSVSPEVETDTPAPVVPSVSYAEYQQSLESPVITSGDRDPVLLSAIKFRNIAQKKSLSVHHLQRRLVDLEYHEAGSDEDGFYAEQTEHAVARFQEDNDLPVTGRVDVQTITAIFKDDPYVDLTVD